MNHTCSGPDCRVCQWGASFGPQVGLQDVGTGEAESCCPTSYWCTATGPQPGTPSADGQTVYPPPGATSGPYATIGEATAQCPATVEVACCAPTETFQLPGNYLFEWDLDYGTDGVLCVSGCGLTAGQLRLTERFTYSELGFAPYPFGFGNVRVPLEFGPGAPSQWVEALAATPFHMTLDYFCTFNPDEGGYVTVFAIGPGNTGVACGASGISLTGNSDLVIYHLLGAGFGVVRCTPPEQSDFAVFPGSELFPVPGLSEVDEGWIKVRLEWAADDGGCNGAVFRVDEYRFRVFAL